MVEVGWYFASRCGCHGTDRVDETQGLAFQDILHPESVPPPSNFDGPVARGEAHLMSLCLWHIGFPWRGGRRGAGIGPIRERKSEMNRSTRKFLPPADGCALCGRTLEEVGGGKRIAYGRTMGVGLSHRPLGGGNPDFPERSIPLGDGSGRYLVVKGPRGTWTDEKMEAVRRTFLEGRCPWVCSVCAGRTCSKCGAPINYPVGADILHDSGCSTHAPALGFHPGCSNKACSEYREWIL